MSFGAPVVPPEASSSAGDAASTATEGVVVSVVSVVNSVMIRIGCVRTNSSATAQ
jgi:hypothetical protein